MYRIKKLKKRPRFRKLLQSHRGGGGGGGGGGGEVTKLVLVTTV
jgi:hypothetical protein